MTNWKWSRFLDYECRTLSSYSPKILSTPTLISSLVAQLGKNLPAMWETWVLSLGCEDPLEKEKSTLSSILAWRIPWTVQSMGSQRVGHDWATFTHEVIIQILLQTLMSAVKEKHSGFGEGRGPVWRSGRVLWGQGCSAESCRRVGLLRGGNRSAEGPVVGKFMVSLEAHRSRCGRRGRFPVGRGDVSSWPDSVRGWLWWKGSRESRASWTQLCIWMGVCFTVSRNRRDPSYPGRDVGWQLDIDLWGWEKSAKGDTSEGHRHEVAVKAVAYVTLGKVCDGVSFLASCTYRLQVHLQPSGC